MNSYVDILYLQQEGKFEEANELLAENAIEIFKKNGEFDWVKHSSPLAHKTKRCANCFVKMVENI